jgi:hypothetical protein
MSNDLHALLKSKIKEQALLRFTVMEVALLLASYYPDSLETVAEWAFRDVEHKNIGGLDADEAAEFKSAFAEARAEFFGIFQKTISPLLEEAC